MRGISRFGDVIQSSRKTCLICVICFGASSPQMWASTLGLSDAIKQARENSPDIKQLEAQYSSARQKTWNAIAPGEPSLSISNNDMVKQFDISTAASKQIQLMQPIGFPGRAILNRSQLADQADAIKYQLNAMRLTVSVNVKTAYYNLQLAQRNIELNTDTKLAFERILQVAKRRYESGASGQVDYLNAQVALLSNENDLEDLLAAEKVARAQLNVLLKQPVDTRVEVEPIKMTYYQEVDLNQAATKMMENRNELKSAQASHKAAEKAYKLAWMSLLPDFQLTLGTTEYREPLASPYSGYGGAGGFPGYSGSPNWPTRTYSAGIQFTIPLWFMFNERSVISGASYDRAAAEKSVDIVYNQSKVSLESTVDTLHSTRKKIEQFEKHILPMSDQSFKLAVTDYSSGRIGFQELADTASTRRQVRLNYATAVVNYLTNYATYAQLIGEDFQ